MEDTLTVMVKDTPDAFRYESSPYRLVGRESLMPLTVARRQAKKHAAKIVKIITSDRKLVGYLTVVVR